MYLLWLYLHQLLARDRRRRHVLPIAAHPPQFSDGASAADAVVRFRVGVRVGVRGRIRVRVWLGSALVSGLGIAPNLLCSERAGTDETPERT